MHSSEKMRTKHHDHIILTTIFLRREGMATFVIILGITTAIAGLLACIPKRVYKTYGIATLIILIFILWAGSI